MASLLPKSTYTFKNLTEDELNKGKIFEFYCDSMQEGLHILRYLEEYNKNLIAIKRGYIGISKFATIYNIDGNIYTFVVSSYYHNGELPRGVRRVIKKLDKPDVVIYSKETDEIICGIENTETAFVGNATWQRQGRVISFLKEEIPFIFIAYYTKRDKSQNTIRRPDSLFPLSFFALTISYKTPAVLCLYEHSDPMQNILDKDGNHPIDMRVSTFQYVLSIIKYGKKSYNTLADLKKCFADMKAYYSKESGKVKDKALPSKTMNILRSNNLENEIISRLTTNNSNFPFFIVDNINEINKSNLFKWNPVTRKDFIVNNKRVGISDYLFNKIGNDIDFYEIENNCPVGITFQTNKLIDRLNEIKVRDDYFWDDSLDETKPTLITIIKLTKNGELTLPDPYNGRISAYVELYKQSFGKVNNIILLMDHSNENEYNPDDAKGQKIFKSINDYATILVDRDFNDFDKNCDIVNKDKRNKYEETTTEDNVTCFFETILNYEKIVPSFINPPCSSWSDLRLYPTSRFLYIDRNEERPDIAYYWNNHTSICYYVGESKDYYTGFKKDIMYEKEIMKINNLTNKIKEELKDLKIEYKKFILFKGTEKDAQLLINDIKDGKKSRVDYIVVIEEGNFDNYDIKMSVLEV